MLSWFRTEGVRLLRCEWSGDWRERICVSCSEGWGNVRLTVWDVISLPFPKFTGADDTLGSFENPLACNTGEAPSVGVLWESRYAAESRGICAWKFCPRVFRQRTLAIYEKDTHKWLTCCDCCIILSITKSYKADSFIRHYTCYCKELKRLNYSNGWLSPRNWYFSFSNLVEVTHSIYLISFPSEFCLLKAFFTINSSLYRMKK